MLSSYREATMLNAHLPSVRAALEEKDYKPDLSQSPANHIANINLGCSTEQMRELLTDTSEEILMMWVV